MIRVRNVKTGRVSEFEELPRIIRGNVELGRLELVDGEPEEKPKRVRATPAGSTSEAVVLVVDPEFVAEQVEEAGS